MACAAVTGESASPTGNLDKIEGINGREANLKVNGVLALETARRVWTKDQSSLDHGLVILLRGGNSKNPTAVPAGISALKPKGVGRWRPGRHVALEQA